MKGRKRLILMMGIAALAVLVAASSSPAATRHIYLAATDGYVYMPDSFQSGGGIGVPFGGPNGWNGVPSSSFATTAGTGPNTGTPNWGGVVPTAGAEDVRGYIRGFVGCQQPPDGNFSPARDCPQPGSAVLPAPILDVDQMDHVFIHLVNIGNKNPNIAPDAHNIHLHGIHTTTQNDGFNEFSFEAPVPNGATYFPVTYYFLAEHAGTYMYHCHVEASEHVHMGLYGALIIRPPGYAAQRGIKPYVYDGRHNDWFDINSATGQPQEFVLLTSEYDSRLHGMVGSGLGFHMPEFRPDYYLLNGRSFPDTIRPINSTQFFTDGIADVGPFPRWSGPPRGWVAGSNNYATYNALVAVDLGNKGRPEGFGKKFLLRWIGLGFTHTPMHIHGWHFRQVGKDANAIPVSAQYTGEYTLNLASGSTYDLIISADCKAGVGMYSTQSISAQGVHGAAAGVAGSLGGTGILNGVWAPDVPYPNFLTPQNNVLSVQLYPIHSHHDHTVTNDGIYPGGAVAVILATNPPNGTCR